MLGPRLRIQAGPRTGPATSERTSPTGESAAGVMRYPPLRNTLMTERAFPEATPSAGRSYRTSAARMRGRPPDNGEVDEPGIRIRPVSDGDRPMLSWLVAELWGSEIVAVPGTSFRPAELPAFIAERAGRR